MKRQTRYVGSMQVRVLALAIGLVSAGAVRAATWTSGKFGNWSDTSANGWNGAYPNAVGADAYYNSNASAAITQDVAGVVIGTLWMGTAPNGKTWTIATNSAGNGITFSVSTGNGRIQANNGQTFTLHSPLTFNCPMVVTNYSAASASTVTLGGSVTSSHSIVIAPVSSSTRDTSVQFNHLDASGPVTVAPQKLSTGKAIVRILGGTLSGPVTAASGASVQKNVAGYAEPLIVSGDNSATFNGTWVIGASANSIYGYMLFASADAAGAGRTLAPANAGIVVAGYAIDQAFIDRITTDSNHGVIAMGDGTTSTNSLDFTALRHTEVHSHLAAVGSATFTGSLTPNSGVATEGYVLGGGGGTLILPRANTLTGARTVQVGNAYILPARQGVVAINNTNNFSGACTIRSGGVLSTTHLANGGLPSGIGMSAKDANKLSLQEGTLRYTGSGASIDRLLQLNYGAPGTIESSGSGPLVFAATGELSIFGAGNKTLVLSGTNTDENAFSPILKDTTTSTNRLTKSGSGLWVLNGTQPYAGPTTISDGELRVAGIIARSAVTVTGGTLAGTGTISNGVTVVGGTLAPGAATGRLTVGSLSFGGDGTLAVELNGTADQDADQVRAQGPVSLGGATLSVTLGFTPPNGSSFTLISNTGPDPVSGTFGSIPVAVTSLTGVKYAASIDYAGGDGNDVVLSLALSGATLILLR